ncbi:MAG: hypothetical protein WD824_06065 [Cyclobacteriaceae bacterium]
MKAFKTFFLLLALLPIVTYAQKVEVKKENSRINSENIPGYQITLASTQEEVQNSLSRYLKTIGKTKQSDDVITISEPLIEGKKYTASLYSTTKQIGNNTAAWIGVNSDSGEETSLNRDLEKLVYDFGVSFYREKIQIQIDESLRALQTVEKKQARLINQNKDLNNKVENNKREKLQLEKSLVGNKTELEDLTKKLQANAKAQDSVAIATEQIRKVVEMHKERQQKVQ